MGIEDLIIDDRDQRMFKVHRSAITSPAISELNKERVFDRCWCYFGYESEVEQPGEYQQGDVVGRPAFFARIGDDRTRVFSNS
jgi:phenylpropionate dioxygenase-like ring-hydroxylating dioxygenase large terminal subunit